MTSNSYKLFSQNAFNGGVETRQENLKDNQVLDAQNYWRARDAMEERPGCVGRRFTLPANSSGSSLTTAVLSNPSGSVNSVLTPGVSTLNTAAYGDFIYLHYAALNSPGRQSDYVFSSFGLTTNTVTKTRGQFQAYTSRGWVNFHTTPYPTMTLFGASNLSYLSFAAPTDLTSTTLNFSSTGNLTGYFFRIHICSATNTTGAPFLAGTQFPNQWSVAHSVDVGIGQLNPQLRPVTLGAYFAKFNSGNLTIPVKTRPQYTPGTYGNYRDRALFTVEYSATGLTTQYDNANVAQIFDNKFNTASLPPVFTVIPEFNTSFLAYQNTVYEIPYLSAKTEAYPDQGGILGPLTAKVNTDPLIVGPLSVSNPTVPYPADQIPQLNAFPAANLIVYLKNQLWAAGIQGAPTLIRWSGSSTEGAYNVWPEDNQVTLSTAKDNSEITAIAPLNDNLVVFKKNSIWQMIDNGVSDVELPLYEPRLVVAGVGTVAHQSVQAVEGGLIFLAEDGFYFYDGTPNIKRISDPIKNYVDQINPARSPNAVATVWRSKQMYICAVSRKGDTTNNDLIFVYDYESDGWYIWKGLNVQCWYQQDGVGLQEELFALDAYGVAYQLERWTQSDNGANIDSWFLTGRWGTGDSVTKTAHEVRVRGENNNPTIRYSVIGDDIEFQNDGATVNPVTSNIVMPRDGEQRWDNPADLPVSGTDKWVPDRRRERRNNTRTTASWFQVKVYKMLKVFGLDLLWDAEGRR